MRSDDGEYTEAAIHALAIAAMKEDHRPKDVKQDEGQRQQRRRHEKVGRITFDADSPWTH